MWPSISGICCWMQFPLQFFFSLLQVVFRLVLNYVIRSSLGCGLTFPVGLWWFCFVLSWLSARDLPMKIWVCSWHHLIWIFLYLYCRKIVEMIRLYWDWYSHFKPLLLECIIMVKQYPNSLKRTLEVDRSKLCARAAAFSQLPRGIFDLRCFKNSRPNWETEHPPILDHGWSSGTSLEPPCWTSSGSLFLTKSGRASFIPGRLDSS